MKNRILRHDLLRHPRFVDLDPMSRIVYLGLLCHVDDLGVCPWDETAIALNAAPGIEQGSVSGIILPELRERGLIAHIDGFLVIRGFANQPLIGRCRPVYFEELPKDMAAFTMRSLDDFNIRIDRTPQKHWKNPIPVDAKPEPELSSPQTYQHKEVAVQIEVVDPPQALVEPFIAEVPPPPAPLFSQMTPTPPMTPIIPAPTVSRDVWQLRLRDFQGGKPWHLHYGPKPGQEGCRVPRDLLIEAGLG